MKHLFFALLLLLFSACKSEIPDTSNITDPNQSVDSTAQSNPTEQNFSFELVEVEHGWGYNLLMNDKLFIRQHSIPSLPGNNGFDSKEKAQKTAEFILHKIKSGMMPPSTNKQELDSLGVL